MMKMWRWKRPFPPPLKIRLTLWYTLSLGFILVLFATFLYLQMRRGLINQLDAALNLAANQALINLAAAGDRLTLHTGENNPGAARTLNDDFVIHLIAPDGTIWETLTSDDEVPHFPVQPPGYNTLRIGGEPWRVYSKPVQTSRVNGLIQVAQELEPLNRTLANLQAQLLLGLPLALLLAGVGGFFLASRALHPIDTMTRTAQAISATDLDQRMHYRGPADEVGRLAQTFDIMLDRLQAAFVRERRFTGDAAHELRTPLTALKGRIGVTLSRKRTPADYEETLQDMEQQVDRLIRLSQDLLFMARLEQGQTQPMSEKFVLDEFVDAVVDQIRPLAATKSITLTQSVPSHLIVQGDMDLLIRLFLNLLDNAIKYTPSGGRVSVTAVSQKETTAIAIADSGPGIPAAHLPHLFERFYRVDSDRSRWLHPNGSGGTGLGLAIAYEIARTLHGSLTVDSTVGTGTTFMLLLPAPFLEQDATRSVAEKE
jgi:heavy metal sensor kinase